MSLSGGPAGGKGVDSNAVDTYDSGDEWDIGVGNLIIDLDADLEKDKLEMSSSKEGGGIAAPPSAVAALPDNIKFVSPVSGGKDSKSKSKRTKNSKEGVKTAAADAIKKEVPCRAPGDPQTQNLNSTLTKGSEKSGKASRVLTAVKKEKDGVSAKTKKDKLETSGDKEPGATLLIPGATRAGPFEGQQNSEMAEHLGHVALDSAGICQPVAMTTEEEEDEEEEEEMDNGECRKLKKMLCADKMDSPSSTSAPPPLHLLAPVSHSDISSSCEQIMVRTRSVAVNTADAALATDPECLGPCEPGTSVNLEGIVWQETEDGMLVVNVTWRNKTYVGTLLDCTRHDWAPPRFCDSPTSDVEMRSGRGRGKRMRPGGNAPANDNSTSSDNKGSSKTRGAAANSKGRRGSQTAGGLEDAKASPSSAKRKTKPASDMEPTSSSEDTKVSKRIRTSSTGTATTLHGGKTDPPAPPLLDPTCPSPVLIDCPHPNCNKKYKHINGLKYHQARSHNEHDVRLDQDADSEYGDELGLHPDPASCNGAAISPARSTTPKGRGFDAPSPSSGKQASKQGKKKGGEPEPEGTDGGEDAACLTDEASNDSMDDRKAKKMAAGPKADKITPKGVKPSRPVAPTGPGGPSLSPYSLQASSPAMGSVVQSVPKSPQMKNVQPKPPSLADPASSPSLTKDKKKKDKKKREGGKECDSPKGAGKEMRPEDVYGEASDALLNGSSDAQQNRLASIKAEADKVYSFTDNAPSPSIGGASRVEGAPPHHLNQNGADSASVKTGSPAYSDISDAGEDGEGRAEGVKIKTEPDAGPREGAKKALFPPQAPSKDSPYYHNYDSYYSPGYANPSPAAAAPPHVEGRVKKEEEPDVVEESKVKLEPQEDRKVDLGAQQPSVIQQRSNMYAQPLYYNQYYVPPYSYSPDQAYHAHLLASNPAYRQQYEERQRLADKKAEGKDEWKQKASVPPSLTRAPSLTDLAAKGKAKEVGPELAKSVIMVKSEDPKTSAAQPEGLKMKLSEAGHHGKDEAKAGAESARPSGVESAMWYRQEPDSRLWPYVYPNKYSEAPKAQEDERWKDERERDKKAKEERLRPKEVPLKEEAKEGAEGRAQMPPEEQRVAGKEMRPSHVQFSSPLAQHQGYMPYMHGPYAYGHQAYEPGHPGYRGMPSVMMQNYPGYLPAGYSFSAYGGKATVGEEGEKASRSSPTVKPTGESKALDLLQQHASQYKNKSPSVSDKAPHERDREGERPRSSPSQRMLPSHHHLGYPLLSGQYDLPYASGLSSSAIVASQQASAPSMYPPARR
ncbi:zinc finger protein 609a [Entelurus aequoreus]|uniref:zinc finger protein 609a n=1 Tax=Entelurus aequoreus TaxID=161455 RepID=UPI002B1D1496|nr:zinc finger protein 609a [Entelurus aequoreus]